jgi:hypothetical protein
MQRQQQMVERELLLEDKNVLPRLIFVSRTHSQLSQVIDSLKAIPFHDFKCLELASKQQLCINKTISDNKSSIN